MADRLVHSHLVRRLAQSSEEAVEQYVRVWEDGGREAPPTRLPDYLITGALANNSGNSYMAHR